MIALEFRQIKNKPHSNLFRINATWLSWLVLLFCISYAERVTVFSISVLLWMIAVDFDLIQSNLNHLFTINATSLSWIVQLFSKSYTFHKTFSISVFFWMIALDLDLTRSNFNNLFRVNATWLSWIVLLIFIPHTFHDTLFLVSLLFWMIEFNDNKDKRLGELFCKNSAWCISSTLSLEILKKNETDMIAVYGRTAFEWHTDDIRVTYEYIQVTYGSHMNTHEWHTDEIQVHTGDIREYIWVSYRWHTVRKKNKVIFFKAFWKFSFKISDL